MMMRTEQATTADDLSHMRDLECPNLDSISYNLQLLTCVINPPSKANSDRADFLCINPPTPHTQHTRDVPRRDKNKLTDETILPEVTFSAPTWLPDYARGCLLRLTSVRTEPDISQ
jgi:hypothetical protein